MTNPRDLWYRQNIKTGTTLWFWIGTAFPTLQIPIVALVLDFFQYGCHMAEIAPLRGIVFNRNIISQMGQVVAPPYDVVSQEERRAFHQSHPHNILRLDLGPEEPGDTHPFDWHPRAAFNFNRWLADGVLVRDERPAIYLTHTEFTDPNTGLVRTRSGFVCLLRLEEFGTSARVRPHERTFSEHKAERLNHLLHVQAHLSQVFAVFPDEKRQTPDILAAGVKGAPLFDFTDPGGQGHRLWAIRDPNVFRALGLFMRDKTIYIADGHHRYETALNYREAKAQAGVHIGPYSPLNYLMVYLCPISDPGLTILPAHRLINRAWERLPGPLDRALAPFFEVREFTFASREEPAARQAFLARLKQEGRSGNAFGLYTSLANTYYMLKKRPTIPHGTALSAWPPLLQQLDTVALTSLIFQEVLGLTEDDLDDTTRISYTSKADEAIRGVNQGRVDLAAILNPTKIEQVQDVAEAGLIMPRKSTYFFPKVTTGLVLNPLNPFEEIVPAW